MARQPRLTVLVLRCADIDQSRRFYETLGLDFTTERHGAGPQHYAASLHGLIFELYPALSSATPIRIGLAVPDVEVAVTAARGIAECVLRFDPDQRPPSALIHDPDGNKIELSALGVEPERAARIG